MDLIDVVIIFVSKTLSKIIPLLHLGSGATWPGEFALRLRPGLLKKFSGQQKTIILVAGTNGKTTTAKMIDTICTVGGKTVYRNESGANLDNGILSAFIHNANLLGNLRASHFIFEVDEATLPHLLRHFHPQVLLLLNLFRDQLDRYGEVDVIVEKWMQVLKTLPKETKLIINGDDPALAFIGKHTQGTVLYFGLDDPKAYSSKLDHANDSIYCPECGNRLTYGGIYFSHLGKWACGQCGFMHPELSIKSEDFESPLEGVYNRYNTVAAALTARYLGFTDEKIHHALKEFTPAFGRMEEIHIDGKRIQLLLSKNPTGFNESLRTVLLSPNSGPLLFVLNDRIPDGRDVSWIWDIDMEMLTRGDIATRQVVISGDRGFDMGIRVKHASVKSSHYNVIVPLAKALETAIKATNTTETLWILPTYSAMLDVRQLLLGRKIL